MAFSDASDSDMFVGFDDAGMAEPHNYNLPCQAL